jgi:hypothetical protein
MVDVSSVDEPLLQSGHPSFEQLMARVQAYGIVPEQYQAYADRRWGAGWKINPHGRAQAWNELERYGNDPQGYLTRSRARCNWPRAGGRHDPHRAFSDLHYGTKNLVEADCCFGAAIDRAIALGRRRRCCRGMPPTMHWTCTRRPPNGWSRRCGDWPTIARC